MKFTNIVIILFSILLLSACSSKYRQPELGYLPRSEYAVINVESCDNDCPIIQEIDGKWRGVGMFKEYEIAPGTRTIKFIYVQGFIQAQTGIIVQLEAKKGEVYGIRANADHSSMTWKPEIYNKSTGQLVSKQIGVGFAY